MRNTVPVFVLTLVLAAPAVARATTVIPLDFKTLTDKATVVAHGRVVALSPQWATDRHGIDTVVTVLVSDYLKGDLGAQITFVVPGGTIGRLRSVRVGAPVFHQGEEVFVFLSGTGPAFPRIVGFNQGVYRVTIDEQSRTRVVALPMLAGEVAAPTAIIRGDPSRRAVSIEEFEASVRAIVQQGGERPPRDSSGRSIGKVRR